MPVTFPAIVLTQKIQQNKNMVIYYPVVRGLNQINVEQKINNLIVSETQKLINYQFANVPSTVKEMLGSFEVKNNQRNILSLTLSNYVYYDKAAHGMTYLKPLTINTKTGENFRLSDLFQTGSNYVERISKIIKAQIKERDIFVLGEFEKIKPNQDFYVADKTLVIFFQLYELTPYAYGFPMFPISVFELQDIILENGPLGKMIAGN
ncbi:DUF3298 and DUF4163 domain-containing protein [Bacillus kwashiorkori]|uniref:DUF3298 and DUF4163 domain-containing protein n=1 Tax=Bacillus kwashiorkori TaxID=1522318 RepID=UPI000781F661|nr:DUF3298 and DUF4163 domain-containing protein [Bacillus kwashiorkori]